MEKKNYSKHDSIQMLQLLDKCTCKILIFLKKKKKKKKS